MLEEIVFSFVITELIAGYVARRAYVLGRRQLSAQIVVAMMAVPVLYVFLVLLIGCVPMNR